MSTRDVEFGDWPQALGRPAVSALRHAGIDDWAALATWTERAVADLHGVGPKALGIMRDELAAQGLGFAAD